MGRIGILTENMGISKGIEAGINLRDECAR